MVNDIFILGPDNLSLQVGAGAPGAPQAPAAGGAEWAVPGAGPLPILDIPTPDCAQHVPVCVKPQLKHTSRRIFSRALMGVKKPGRYYFLTVTTTPERPLNPKKDWNAIRMYLKRVLPGTVHFHVTTGEGNGVIHIILRLGRKEKRLEIKPFRAWWKSLTGATQVRIVRVQNKKDLARYIADQRHKKKLAGEFAWQDLIVAWGYSAGWLPKGFGPHFGRFWFKSRDADMGQREMFLHDWLLRCYEDLDQVTQPPIVRSG